MVEIHAGQTAPSVLFNVIVEDAHHNHPADLTNADFALVDDAHPQKNVDVRFASDAKPNAKRELSILVDASSEDSIRLAKEFVGSADTSNLKLSIWDATQPQLVQPFTSDRAALTEAFSKLHADSKDTAHAAVDPVVRDACDHVQNDHFRPWLAILFALAKEQGAQPGRKEALYFVENEDQSGATNDQVTALISNAAHAQLSVYIVESRRMTASNEAHVAEMVSGKKASQHSKQAGEEASSGSAVQNVFRDVTSKTGGLYAAARTKAAPDLLRAVTADMSTYYEIGYEPDVAKLDGHFRNLQIKCLRSGTKVRAASGYVSAPPASFLDLSPFEPNLYASLWSKQAQSEFPLQCDIMRFGHTNGKVQAALIVQLPLHAMQAEDDDGGSVSRLHFSLLALVRNEDGRIVSRFDEDKLYEHATGKAAKHEAGLFTFARSVWLDPGKYEIEIAARDQNGAHTSTKNIAVTIAPSESDIHLSDIMLVQGVETEPNVSADDDPLKYGTGRIIPFAAAQVDLGKRTQLPVLITLHPNAGSTFPRVDLEIHRGDELFGTFPLLSSLDAAGDYRALVMLDRQSFTPGHYTFLARAEHDAHVCQQLREVEFVSNNSAASEEADNAGPEPTAPVLSLDETPLLPDTAANHEQELHDVIEGARRRAIDYIRGLPNFTCVKATQQYAATASAHPAWKLKNQFSELLRYSSGFENYRTVEVNGERTSIDHSKLPGLRTDGELGQLLDAVYSTHAAANFRWKGKARINGLEQYIVEYSVDRAHSIYMLSNTDRLNTVQCSFRGVLHIDARTFATRYVSVEAQSVPAAAEYAESTMSVKYDYVTFEGKQFLLPKSASIAVRVGRKKLLKDEVQFRNYRRYHTSSRLVSGG